ncbi:alpha/beta-hydrolase [Trematosphaeria pertusa]|uniref:Alpha/beta-hydrolase n=1 Tax=Trematosphaeria pertusa TaxID=390896 RepID=A0A6A6IVW4_9PLEO|nr:alpha/beta-hydrolase [Trematosphaeria pertusa]KAF2254691.1 alpha/beta-hydrolase [Trematosphaeria pertusa]
MAPTKPTILIIPGAWHTPDSYTKLKKALEADGYDVHVPALPTANGTRPPTADLYGDVSSIRSYAESLLKDGRTVVALMHSYGGQVGSNAFYGLSTESRAKASLPGGIAHLIYMAAYALFEGKSVADKFREFIDDEVISQLLDVADDQTCVIRDPKLALLGDELNGAEAEAYLQTLARWNGAALYQGAKNAAWREMPVTYISCTKDMTAPFEWQKTMIEGMRNEGREVEVLQWETNHSPHVTMTKEVADVVKKVAGGIN